MEISDLPCTYSSSSCLSAIEILSDCECKVPAVKEACQYVILRISFYPCQRPECSFFKRAICCLSEVYQILWIAWNCVQFTLCYNRLFEKHVRFSGRGYVSVRSREVFRVRERGRKHCVPLYVLYMAILVPGDRSPSGSLTINNWKLPRRPLLLRGI